MKQMRGIERNLGDSKHHHNVNYLKTKKLLIVFNGIKIRKNDT